MKGPDMENLTYGWEGPNPLAVEITKPITHVSIYFDEHGRPMDITLWRADGSGLTVFSEMHDIAERMEIGVLRFEQYKSLPGSRVTLPIAPEFGQRVDAFKLSVNESGVKAESGILLRAKGGSEITIVAAAMPCFIAIKGVVEQPHIFEPEYPIENYERLPIKVEES
jgi:hypothetical protein